eukprot:CAMPEP_0181294394 /NCGR_PEP_ID=MMETSP1101-20121128/3576_1 /TAXON_ID=46948 /ORGANISM="Rhodomonas abbreviata, Strain Caron Lab Isolate" /LENGTH=123 /DNA_ID=CAMNT_0023399047 /DNA_START=28 /DNA_END=399 /DNA_ORIENTATION=+
MTMSAKLPFLALFALTLAGSEAGSALAGVDLKNCEKFPEVIAAEDEDHYCNFVHQEVFDDVSWSGAVSLAISVVLVAIIIVTRDIMKVFDCCGVTKGQIQQAPIRSLTTMSAGFAPNTHATTD